MALIQKLHGENHTFEDLSDHIFKQILHSAKDSERIDIIFDVYKQRSIKTVERLNRGFTDGLSFNQIRPNHKIKNWRRLLSCTESKNNLIRFLTENWKNEKSRCLLGEVVLYVTNLDKCVKITKEDAQEVEELCSNHEEADTRLVLHAKHAAEKYSTLVCISDDTDVLVLFLAFSSQIKSNVFIRRGTRARVRMVDITKISTAIGSETCKALLGLHCWTGCDTVSSMTGQGKMKALKIISKNDKLRSVLSSIGNDWNLSEETLAGIEELTCQMYCSNTKVKDVNTLRYQIFRAKKGNLESGQLPPCSDTLEQHTRRANYQAGIWKRSLENYPDIPDPTHGHGWKTDEDGNLEINWMTGSPAPETVLSLMACKCSRTCKPSECSCILNGLKCTSACKLTNCSNVVDEVEDDLRGHEDSDSCNSDSD